MLKEKAGMSRELEGETRGDSCNIQQPIRPKHQLIRREFTLNIWCRPTAGHWGPTNYLPPRSTLLSPLGHTAALGE